MYFTNNANSHGAFAKRALPTGTIITASPLVHFPSRTFTNMYDSIVATEIGPDGIKRSIRWNGQPYYQRVLDRVIGQQILLNYCFGHNDSTILLCPYGAGVNNINHHSTGANVRVQWAPEGSTNHNATWFNMPPESMEGEYGTKLVLEYVATRDIAQGEELLMDYGPSWQMAWERHVDDWSKGNVSTTEEACGQGYTSVFDFNRACRHGYFSAFQFNALYGKDLLRTAKQQEADPYPINLLMRCHPSLTNPGWDPTTLTWMAWDKGFQCTVTDREDDGESGSYVVSYVWQDANGQRTTKNLGGVPRHAIAFVDRPYSTDLHLPWGFRHPLGIPDEIMPAAWRNLVDPAGVGQACIRENNSDGSNQTGAPS
jgi:hypothetical protein